MYLDEYGRGDNITMLAHLMVVFIGISKMLFLIGLWLAALYYLYLCRQQFGIGLWLMGTWGVWKLRKRR